MSFVLLSFAFHLMYSGLQADDTITIFSDTAVGVKHPTIYKINNLPCGKRYGLKTLFCLKPVDGLPTESYQAIKDLVFNFIETIRIWKIASKADKKMADVFYSNISAVVFEDGITFPELRLERGTGNPIPESNPAIYLRLPRQYNAKLVKTWAATIGYDWWQALIHKGYLGDENGMARVKADAKLADQPFYREFAINIVNIDSSYSGATPKDKQEFTTLQKFLMPEEKKPSLALNMFPRQDKPASLKDRKILEACLEEGERHDQYFDECLKDRSYSGSTYVNHYASRMPMVVSTNFIQYNAGEEVSYFSFPVNDYTDVTRGDYTDANGNRISINQSTDETSKTISYPDGSIVTWTWSSDGNMVNVQDQQSSSN